MSKKQTTIDDLAVMVNKGFQEVHNKMDNGLKITHKLIGHNAEKIDTNAKKIDKLDERMINLNSRFDLLEKEVRDIRSKLSKSMIQKQYFELEERLTVVEEKLAIKY